MIGTNTEQHIQIFKQLLESELYLPYVMERDRIRAGYIELDFNDIAKHCFELSEDLAEDPREVIKAAEAAMAEMDLHYGPMQVHLINVPDSFSTLIREKRAQDLGRLIRVDGIIRDKTNIIVRAKHITYECPSCANTLPVIQDEDKKKEPSQCGCGRKGRFREIERSRVNVQRMQLEELPENMGSNGQPSTLKVYLEETLISVYNEPKFNPGSKVRLSGYLKERPIRLKSGAETAEYDYEFIGLNIENMDEKKIHLEVSNEDEQRIWQISDRTDCVHYLAQCAFPHIYGYHEIKKGLLLQIVGGVRKRNNGTHLRGDIHALLIGDPGTAKSKLLSTVNNIVPSARRGSGKGASGVGLTASAVKDEYLGTWSLRAGLLPLANGSIAIVDELDKMHREDRDHMHEALEDQQIPITKASIQATLRSECSLLAAANPKYHRFSPYEDKINQIDLPVSLINRFDLIFPILDMPDQSTDREKFDHVAEMHRMKDSDTIQGEIGEELLRKYLFRARTLKPRITDAAKSRVVEYVCDVRRKVNPDNGTASKVPINARQIDGLMRLSEGFAKLRLSNAVELQDAEQAINITEHFMRQIAYDDTTDAYDTDKLQSGVSGGERERYLTVKKLIEQHSGTYNEKVIPIQDIAGYAQQEGIPEDQMEEAIKKLKRKGDVCEVKTGYIQLL